MNSSEIDLLDFIKRLLLSFKSIFFFILISIVVGLVTYDKNGVTVLDARIHDNNGIYDGESVDYIKHLLNTYSESLSKEMKYNTHDFTVIASSDNISVTYRVSARTNDEELIKNFAQEVVDDTQIGYSKFYKEKNNWISDYDNKVRDQVIQKYDFTNISEYRNYIFWKEYSGADVFLVEYADPKHISNSLSKRLFFAAGFGLFFGLALSIVRIAIKQ